MGAFGAALATMVANLSSHERVWDDSWEEFSDWAEKGKAHHDELLHLIDEDTEAFSTLMAAFGLPSGTEDEKAAKAMSEIGNPNSISDAAVGAIAARSAVMGAYLNVNINAPGIHDKAWIEDVLKRGQEMQEKAAEEESRILEVANKALER